MKKERMSNIELLRILAMLGIVFFHYSDHGCRDISEANSTEINYIFQSLLRIGGGVGNCLFVLMAGYFGINSKITIVKTIKLWLQVVFYSLFSLVIYVAVTGNITGSLIYYSITPIIHDVYWFFTTYIVIYLCSPLINGGIKSLSKGYLTLVVSVCVLFFSVLPTFGEYNFIDNNRVGVFVTLYLIGAYIRIYGMGVINENKTRITCFLVSVILIVLCEWSIVSNGWSGDVGARYRYVWGMEQALVLMTAVSIFLLFLSINISCNCKINSVAGTVFGIYLIHMNPLTTNFIWDNIMRIEGWFQSDWMPLYLLISGFILFLICFAIEYLRLKSIDAYITKKLSMIAV